MANWNDGYVTDVDYTYGFYREMAPVWIAAAATLLGTASADPAGKLCYADLGCGNGITALVVAATMPNAQVWGFDFNPAHVAFGRDVARRAGLTNIHFEEASFEELSRLPAAALPAFDYIVSHGVLSYLSLENRDRLFGVIGQRLAPGGIAYLSYNVATGWPGVAPVRVLMRLLAEARVERSDLAATGVLDMLDRMKNAGAAVFQQHPAAAQMIQRLRGMERRYIAHELMNRDWHTVMFQTVAAAMADAKCDYIGSATLSDNLIDFTVPEPMRARFAEMRDPVSRETFRDLACGMPFRRDLYQRGPRRMSVAEFARATDQIALTLTFPPDKQPVVIDGLLGPFTASDPIYPAVLTALAVRPMTFGELRRQPPFAGMDPAVPREAVTMLLNAGYLAPLLPGPPDHDAASATARLNHAFAALCDDGRVVPFVAYPALGSAIHADPLDIMALDEMRTRGEADEPGVVDAVAQRLARSGRHVRQNGQPLRDPAAVRARLSGLLAEFRDKRLPTMRRWGALPASMEAV
jgi:SAM-dependent methyltransferase